MLDRFKVPEDIAVRVLASDMRTTVERLFRALGMSDPDAEQAADVLIYADVRGIDSHGVSNMVRAYVAGFESGALNPVPVPKVETDAGATLTIDGDRGLGLAVGPPAMEQAIERAARHGVGIAIVFNAGHYGAAAYHAVRALPAHMIGVSMTTGGVQVAPTWGAEPLLGLNPIGIAVPSRHEVPYVFDASMSSVAGNKIRLLRRVGGDALAAQEADRRDDLLTRGLAAKEETEAARGSATAASASCVGSRQSAVAARARIDVIEARLNRAQAELERSYIRAPMSGRVLEILKWPGEIVQGEGFIELGKVDRMYAIAEVYETDVSRISVGQRATVTSDALAGPITGTVEFIRPKVMKQDELGTDPAARKDARIVEVRILLDDAEAVSGLTNLQVEVVIRS